MQKNNVMHTSYLLSHLAQICNGELHTTTDNLQVKRLCFDSRLLYDPSGVLFFALQSGQNDGHNYISEIYQKGFRMFVVRNTFQTDNQLTNASYIKVDDPLKALQEIATYHRKQFSTEVVAITGSNGKTIVKEWLSQLFNNDFDLVRSPRSYNSQIGVPLSVWEMNVTHQLAIFEAGISKLGEMIHLKNIILPTVGILTNIGTAHQENFSSSATILHEKLILFDEVKSLLYNFDDASIRQEVTKRYPKEKLLSWGKNEGSNLQLISIKEKNLLELTFLWKNKQFEIKLPFFDQVSVENIMPVILFALYKGYETDVIAQRVVNIEPVAMRMERKDGRNNCLIINDSYNSDFTSLEVALNFLDQQAKKKGMERTLILSDMLQTGYKDEELYPKIAKLVRTKNIMRFIGVGSSMVQYASFFRESDLFFQTTKELLSTISHSSFHDEAILIKGARSFSFEKVSDLLELKQHSTVLEINLNALVNNLNVFKHHLKPTTKVLAMVKAFGYGSGSYEIAAALQDQKVDYLGVAFADEGMELRNNGITVPIIVMNPEIKSFKQMLEYGLEPEIYSLYVLKKFDKAAREHGAKEINIHLKLDTGMNRFGFSSSALNEIAQFLKVKPYLKIASLFSHLVGSDESKHDDFTHQQIEVFANFAHKLAAKTGTKFTKHILNSAGIERFPQFQFDMVRLGIGLYGFSSTNDVRLQNVLSLKTYVSQVKEIGDNNTIGYGRKGILKSGDTLAVIPIGYADGLNRHLSNGVGEVSINNMLYPIVGNICMDTCMVDISKGNVKEGDEVIIFGDNYPLSIIAEKLDTIPYEIMTSISQRVRRIYFRE